MSEEPFGWLMEDGQGVVGEGPGALAEEGAVPGSGVFVGDGSIAGAGEGEGERVGDGDEKVLEASCQL